MKILAISLLVIVLALQYRLWVSDGGMREVWRLRREVTAQTDQNAGLKERNRTLAAEVQDLKKGTSAIEERARTDLGMTGSNETFFQVVPKETVQSKPNTLMANQASSSATATETPLHAAHDGSRAAGNGGGLTVSAGH